ncbi:MAG TPA: adenylyl-sulfate kinase [Intrasporangium sp.]|uniref:adenylyl-sulfate kinase n=1 Tax=Intrasporangium sp. TaxID=1925024 RepID=UPI002D76805D|nr:adenylyl-sulfate kinase [Intrasporangium sp.]HET7399530.1 adenylyl-sulfate kinase [Intrasporangium sp.]
MSVAVVTGDPRIVVEGAAAADLELMMGGVRLPWGDLGGRAAEPLDTVRDDLRVPLPVELADSVVASRRLILTDATCLPIATLEDARVEASADGARAVGDVRPLSPGHHAGWLPALGRILVAQRPLLDGDLEDEDGGPVVVLVPSGSSPGGMPSATLRAAIEAAVADRGDVVVRTAPIVWRDGTSDRALVRAVAEAAGRPVRLLSFDDPRWVAADLALEQGRPADGVDPRAVDVLSRWRPPRSSRGLVVFFTGLSGSGKSTLAGALVAHLDDHCRRAVTLLDGDLVRRMLSAGLGFDREGRDANVRRIGFVAAQIARHGGLVVCAPIAPFAETRRAVREMVQEVGDFVLVHVATPLEVCEQRDRKGLYAQARAGQLSDFTGVSSPYEPPLDADLVVDTTGRTLEACLQDVLEHLRKGGWLS